MIEAPKHGRRAAAVPLVVSRQARQPVETSGQRVSTSEVSTSEVSTKVSTSSTQATNKGGELGAKAEFSVLVVCTGNICRSPLAEHLLRARFAAAGVPATVNSAGTRAMVGYDMTDEAAALAVGYGAEDAPHSAQLLTPELIADADLVVTATREHRSAVVSMYPKSTRYTFTLNQLARLMPGVAGSRPAHGTPPADGIDSLIEAIAASRGMTPPPGNPVDDDIEDPYRQSSAVYARAAAAIDAAVTTIAAGITASIGNR